MVNTQSSTKAKALEINNDPISIVVQKDDVKHIKQVVLNGEHQLITTK